MKKITGQLLTTDQVAEILKVSHYTVRHWARTGRLAAIKLEQKPRSWFFYKRDVMAVRRALSIEAVRPENPFPKPKPKPKPKLHQRSETAD